MSEERAPSGERGRWSSRRKMEVVLRALRGEDLDALSRELEPDEGETLRKLKGAVTLAAKEVNRAVGYGESESGTLLVWLEERQRKARLQARRGGQQRRTEHA